MGVWRGKADLTAWGPLSCVRMLWWMHTALRQRADAQGRLVWTDHLGRTNHGKGWFDPAPDTPLITCVIDEWPLIMADAALAPWAEYFALSIIREDRKAGGALILGSQEGDLEGAMGSGGLRDGAGAYNGLGHRCDLYTKRQLGLDGNPADLPVGVHGVAYLKGYDKRSGIVQRTKHIREYLRRGETGVDVREIAERISRDPITYDPAVLKAITTLGYTGQGQVLDDGDGWSLAALEASDKAAAEEVVESTQAAERDRTAGQVSPHDLSAVWAAVEGGHDSEYDLMHATDLSGLDVIRAVDQLIDTGYVRQNPDGTYVPAALTSEL